MRFKAAVAVAVAVTVTASRLCEQQSLPALLAARAVWERALARPALLQLSSSPLRGPRVGTHTPRMAFAVQQEPLGAALRVTRHRRRTSHFIHPLDKAMLTTACARAGPRATKWGAMAPTRQGKRPSPAI